MPIIAWFSQKCFSVPRTGRVRQGSIPICFVSMPYWGIAFEIIILNLRIPEETPLISKNRSWFVERSFVDLVVRLKFPKALRKVSEISPCMDGAQAALFRCSFYLSTSYYREVKEVSIMIIQNNNLHFSADSGGFQGSPVPTNIEDKSHNDTDMIMILVH